MESLKSTLRNVAETWLVRAVVVAGLLVAYVLGMVFNGYDFYGIVGLPIILGAMFGVFLLFAWVEDKVHAALVAPLYVLTLAVIGFSLWFLFGPDGSAILVGTEIVLVVLGLILLPAFYAAKRDEVRAAAKAKRPEGSPTGRT